MRLICFPVAVCNILQLYNFQLILYLSKALQNIGFWNSSDIIKLLLTHYYAQSISSSDINHRIYFTFLWSRWSSIEVSLMYRSCPLLSFVMTKKVIFSVSSHPRITSPLKCSFSWRVTCIHGFSWDCGGDQHLPALNLALRILYFLLPGCDAVIWSSRMIESCLIPTSTVHDTGRNEHILSWR